MYCCDKIWSAARAPCTHGRRRFLAALRPFLSENDRTFASFNPIATNNKIKSGDKSPHSKCPRRGQSLVEFAIVSVAVYLLLGGILTFGQLFYSDQAIQQAADVAARETSRTPLPAATTNRGSGISLMYALWGDAETDPSLLPVRNSLFDSRYLRFDLTENVRPGESVLNAIRKWPIVNQMLYSVMIVEREHQALAPGGRPEEHEYLWYPGAVPCKDSSIPGATVWCIAHVDSRSSDGAETITWVPVIEEITSPADHAANVSPFSVASPERGLVALRINYGCQSATMSAFPPPKTWPPEPVGPPWGAHDNEVRVNPSNYEPINGTEPPSGVGTYSGPYGLGRQEAWAGLEQGTNPKSPPLLCGTGRAAISTPDFGPSDLSPRGVRIATTQNNARKSVKNTCSNAPRKRKDHATHQTQRASSAAVADRAAGPRGHRHWRRGDRGRTGGPEGDRPGKTVWSGKPAIPAGWVLVPVSARPIPAYTMVNRDYLIDPKTGTWAVQPVPPEVAKAVITDVAKIRGRVMKREKPAIFTFTESDFLPVGTRPGIVAGTPLGKRAYTFNASNLDGCVYQVKEGDHVDLMVSVPVDMPGAGHSGPSGASVIATPDTLLRPKRTLEIPLVQDGVVVSPVTARIDADHEQFAHERHDHPQRAGGGDRDRRGARRSGAAGRGQGIEEQAHLRGAFGPARRPLRRLPCSGRPAGRRRVECLRSLPRWARRFWAKPSAAAPDKASPPPEGAKTVNSTKSETPAKDRVAVDITPGSNPMADVRFMEVMIGTKRQFVLFNGPGNSPVVQPQDDSSTKAGAGTTPAAGSGAAPAATPADASEESEQ